MWIFIRCPPPPLKNFCGTKGDDLGLKKIFLFIVILVSAISLIVDAGRAWNGLAFSGFGDRLVTFIILA